MAATEGDPGGQGAQAGAITYLGAQAAGRRRRDGDLARPQGALRMRAANLRPARPRQQQVQAARGRGLRGGAPRRQTGPAPAPPPTTPQSRPRPGSTSSPVPPAPPYHRASPGPAPSPTSAPPHDPDPSLRLRAPPQASARLARPQPRPCSTPAPPPVPSSPSPRFRPAPYPSQPRPRGAGPAPALLARLQPLVSSSRLAFNPAVSAVRSPAVPAASSLGPSSHTVVWPEHLLTHTLGRTAGLCSEGPDPLRRPQPKSGGLVAP